MSLDKQGFEECVIYMQVGLDYFFFARVVYEPQFLKLICSTLL